MRFELLGPLVVRRGGEHLSLPPMQRKILGLLLLNAGRAVPGDRLLELLWGPGQGSSKTLQVHISQLRRALSSGGAGDGSLLRNGSDGYLLSPGPGEVDLPEFEKLVADTRRQLKAGDPEGAVASFREAARIRRGVLLADFGEHPLVLGDRARFEDLWASAVEDQVDARLALGEHGVLLPELRQLVRQHPLRERLAAQLMLALYRSGRQAEASDVYQGVKLALQESAGISPGRALEAMLKAVLNQSPDLDLQPPRLEASSAPLRHNLPEDLTRFLGRSRDLSSLSQSLTEGTRLLTLVGPPGVGKSRLARELARRALGQNPDGIWIVDLDRVSHPSLVASAVVEALELPEKDGSEPLAQLVRYLRPRQTVLVLDSCEHLIEACAELTQTVLERCPSLTVITTSREPMGLPGETIHRVDPFHVPSRAELKSPAAALSFPAIGLFAERAGRAASGFHLREDNLELVRELCARLDGIPLALELAAGRIGTLPLAEIVRRVNDRFQLLVGGSRGALPRYQTLRSAIDWSYELLTDPEKVLLQRLSVFAGPAPLAAVEEVCHGDLVRRGDAGSLVAMLANKSLLSIRSIDGESWVRLLDTVREYAEGRLADSPGDAERVRDQHCRWYSTLAREAEPHLHGPRQREVTFLIGGHQGNIRAALEWAQRSPESGLTTGFIASLWFYWYLGGHHQEARTWISDWLDAGAPGERAEKSLALGGSVILVGISGDDELARRLYSAALKTAKAGREPGQLGFVEIVGALVAINLDRDFPEAKRLWQSGIERLRSSNLWWALAMGLNDLGHASVLLKDSDDPEPLLQEALAIGQANSDDWMIGMALGSLAMMSIDRENLDQAMRYERLSLRHMVVSGALQTLGYSLKTVAMIARDRGDSVRAAKLLGCAARMDDELGRFKSGREHHP